jgi:hypothetical protein
MLKVTPLAPLAAFITAVASAAIPPAERLEGESASESDPGYYDKSYYLSDDNPFAPASDGDADLGEQVLLERQSRLAPISVSADTFLYWSNNIGSVAVGEDDGWFFGGSVQARWKQRLIENLFLDTYVYQDAYLYDSDGLDFQSSEFGLGLIATIPFLNDLSIYGRYEFLYLHGNNPL